MEIKIKILLQVTCEMKIKYPIKDQAPDPGISVFKKKKKTKTKAKKNEEENRKHGLKVGVRKEKKE